MSSKLCMKHRIWIKECIYSIFYGPFMIFIPAVYPVQDFFVEIAQTPQKNYGPSLINK